MHSIWINKNIVQLQIAHTYIKYSIVRRKAVLLYSSYQYILTCIFCFFNSEIMPDKIYMEFMIKFICNLISQRSHFKSIWWEHNGKWTGIRCIIMYHGTVIFNGKFSVKEKILKGDSSCNFATVFETLNVWKE